jgi:hypothetical protein
MKTADTTAVRLYVREENRDGYYHLLADVVTDGPDGTRNAEQANNIWVDDLEVYSQGSNEDAQKPEGRRLYAWEVHFKPYSVDARKAAAMTQTFKLLERKLARLDAKLGRPVTYGQYLGRVALALGADGFVFPKTRHASSGLYREMDLRHCTLADGIAHADYLVQQWVEAK